MVVHRGVARLETLQDAQRVLAEEVLEVLRRRLVELLRVTEPLLLERGGSDEGHSQETGDGSG